MNNISSFIVLNNNGSINHEASISQFAGELLRFEAERELEAATIGAVIHAVFDAHLGKRLATPYVVGEALKALNAQPENYKVLTGKVQDFIRTSPEFHTGKGKGGGIARVCDLTPPHPAGDEQRDLECRSWKLLASNGSVTDTIYAEGQRRYVESLSAYARQE